MYKRNALQLVEALRTQYPDFDFVINDTKPRRLSFEILLVLNDNSKLDQMATQNVSLFKK